jgi:hypothetical protein
MSIRAYRVIEIKLAETSSFSLWNGNQLIQFLEDNLDLFSFLNSEGTGTIEIPVKILKKALIMQKQLNIDENTAKSLQQDINFAKSIKYDSVIYECF